MAKYQRDWTIYNGAPKVGKNDIIAIVGVTILFILWIFVLISFIRDIKELKGGKK